jgi:hypothetical protein
MYHFTTEISSLAFVDLCSGDRQARFGDAAAAACRLYVLQRNGAWAVGVRYELTALTEY